MSKRSNDTDVHTDILWGIQHDAFDDGVDAAHLRNFDLGVASPKSIATLRNKVRRLQNMKARGGRIPFRKSRLNQGQLRLGSDQHRSVVRLVLQWLAAGLLILGNTGCGKSTLVWSLICQVAATGCKTWVTDLYKTQMRQLKHVLMELGVDLIIIRPADWKYNLLQAAGHPRTHLAMACDVLSRRLDAQPRSQTILRQAGHALYAQFNIWKGQDDVYPCLFDLYEWVRTAKGLNHAARESLLDKLGALLISVTPACGAFRRAWTAQGLQHHSIVFEMGGGISEADKSIRLESLLFSLLQHKVAQGSVNVPLSLWLCFEDAQRFTGTSTNAELSPLEELACILRGLGIALCFTAQTMHGLSRSLIPNMATKIMGRMGMGQDWHALSADLGLKPEQRDWAQRHLNVGQFICQASEGDWREPCLFTAPNVQIPTIVSDDEASESVKALEYIKTIPATEFATWQPANAGQLITDVSGSSTPSNPVLSDVERRLLAAVVVSPGQSVSHYRSLMKLSGKRMAQVRAKLIQLGFLREHKVQVSHRGRPALILEPLERAVAAVDKTPDGV